LENSIDALSTGCRIAIAQKMAVLLLSTVQCFVDLIIKSAEKSNEITTIPELIHLLHIKGEIITTDAMGCQKDIAEKIVCQDGGYLFAARTIRRDCKIICKKFPLKELNNSG
jgi:hypothetical protein